jgi:hypothetical protein
MAPDQSGMVFFLLDEAPEEVVEVAATYNYGNVILAGYLISSLFFIMTLRYEKHCFL